MPDLVDLFKLEGTRIRASSGRSTSHNLILPSTESCWESSSGSSAYLLISLPHPIPSSSLRSLHLTFQGGYSASIVRLGISTSDIIEEGEEDKEDEDEEESMEQASHQHDVVEETLKSIEGGSGLSWILEAHPEDSNAQQRFSIDAPQADGASQTQQVKSFGVHFKGGADDWGRLTLYAISLLAEESSAA